MSRVWLRSSSRLSRRGRLRRRSVPGGKAREDAGGGAPRPRGGGAAAGGGGGGGGGGAALFRAGSRRLHTRGAIVRLPHLFDGRPHRRRGPMLGEIILDQAETKVVAGAFGQHLAREQPSCRAHAAGQIPQPQTQTCRVEVGDSGTAQ